MSLGVKGRRSYPLLRLGSYKPMAFRPWIVDYSTFKAQKQPIFPAIIFYYLQISHILSD